MVMAFSMIIEVLAVGSGKGNVALACWFFHHIAAIGDHSWCSYVCPCCCFCFALFLVSAGDGVLKLSGLFVFIFSFPLMVFRSSASDELYVFISSLFFWIQLSRFGIILASKVEQPFPLIWKDEVVLNTLTVKLLH